MPSRFYRLLRKWIGLETVPAAPLIESHAVISTPVDGEVERCLNEIGMDQLPNDLTRMIYLASLRDCNSGVYLHPQLSQWMGVTQANRVLNTCHKDVFDRLLRMRLTGYVVQLEEYIRYSRTGRDTMLRTWQSLQAYRSTLPVTASALSSELFCLNIEMALIILRDSPTFADEWGDYSAG